MGGYDCQQCLFIAGSWNLDKRIENHNAKDVHDFEKYWKFDAFWNIKLGKWKYFGSGIDPMYVI